MFFLKQNRQTLHFASHYPHWLPFYSKRKKMSFKVTGAGNTFIFLIKFDFPYRILGQAYHNPSVF